MRASKLRLPESTATTLRFSLTTAASISGVASGPELPMQVVQLRELRSRAPVHSEEALLLGVALDQRDVLGAAAGHLQISQRLSVDREQRRRGAVLRTHVAQGCAVGHGQAGEAVAAELD